MKYLWLRHAVICIALALPTWVLASAFSFGVIAPSTDDSDQHLRAEIASADAANLAFVVANGIKSVDEPCSDRLYESRKALFAESGHGLIVALAGSDWSDCRTSNGNQTAIGRLNRLRDLFFTDEWSEGATKLPLIRQSSSARFRSFSENARWEIGDTMFATINLPAPNNHYLFEAGRNSEFEDRLVANRDWLNRIFTVATLHRLRHIVLFCDADPFLPPASVKRDGFAETRRLLLKLAGKFRGKILLVHRQGNTSAGIQWQGNIGRLGVGHTWIKVTVSSASRVPFSLSHNEPSGEHKR